jgi:hypothetical protein
MLDYHIPFNYSYLLVSFFSANLPSNPLSIFDPQNPLIRVST